MPPQNQQSSSAVRQTNASTASTASGAQTPEQTKTLEPTKVDTVINTRKASPSEIFESRFVELLSAVMNHQLPPSAAVRELNAFWRSAFTDEERDVLINREVPGNIVDLSVRSMAAANMLSSEISVLISSHLSSRSF